MASDVLTPSSTNATGVDRYLREIEKQLDLQGYFVDCRTKVAGRSGATHDVDLHIKDSMGRHFIVELKYSNTLIGEEEILRMFMISLDADVAGVLMVVHPGLTEKASELARLYGIRVLDISSLDRLSSILRGLTTCS